MSIPVRSTCSPTPPRVSKSPFRPSDRIRFSQRFSRSYGFKLGFSDRPCFVGCSRKGELIGGGTGKALAGDGGGRSVQGVDSSPVTVELQPISDEGQFDRVLAQAQHLEESVAILWMANWCRKCIYLKPKLEKLAAGYYPRLRFYCVDVNSVPHRLVVRAGVTKMPTIQIWRNSKKQAEVIGGHKAHLVVNEIRDMIENEDTA